MCFQVSLTANCTLYFVLAIKCVFSCINVGTCALMLKISTALMISFINGCKIFCCSKISLKQS